MKLNTVASRYPAGLAIWLNPNACLNAGGRLPTVSADRWRADR